MACGLVHASYSLEPGVIGFSTAGDGYIPFNSHLSMVVLYLCAL